MISFEDTLSSIHGVTDEGQWEGGVFDFVGGRLGATSWARSMPEAESEQIIEAHIQIPLELDQLVPKYIHQFCALNPF